MKILLFFIKDLGIIRTSFSKEIFRKGGLFNMTTSDLIWHLIEILLEDKEKESDADGQKKD